MQHMVKKLKANFKGGELLFVMCLGVLLGHSEDIYFILVIEPMDLNM